MKILITLLFLLIPSFALSADHGPVLDIYKLNPRENSKLWIRVIEFTPKSFPNKICILTVVRAGWGTAATKECFDVGKK